MNSHDPSTTDPREPSVAQSEENQTGAETRDESVENQIDAGNHADEESSLDPATLDPATLDPALDSSETADLLGSEEFVSAALDAARKDVLRAQAELENFRKRARREMEENRLYAELPLISDLLPVLDNLNRAIEAEAGDATSGLIQGVKMVSDLLTQTLTKHDCQPIAAVAQPFDPNFHAAISQQPSAEHEPGTVLMEVQRGYLLHDRVIRPAQVIIATSDS